MNYYVYFIFITIIIIISYVIYYFINKINIDKIKNYKYKFYKIKNERKSLIDIDKDIIETIEFVNNNKEHVRNNIKDNFNESLRNYKFNRNRAKKEANFDYCHLRFYQIIELLNNYLLKLNDFEKDLAIKSNNYTKTSCDILDKDTFDNAFNIINSIIFLFANTIHNYYFTHLIQYYEFLYDKYTLLYRYINLNNIVNIGNIKTVFVANHHEACEWVFKHFTNDKIPSIFHVDSHPDLNTVYDPDKLVEIRNDIYNPDNIKELYTNILNNDIGSVIVPCIHPYKYNGGFYWLMPRWINKHKNSDKGIRTQIIKINENDEIIEIFWGNSFYNKNNEYIKKCNPINSNSGYVDDFFNFNNQIDDGFILNIDLDYFVTIGEEDVFYDNVSHNRTTIDSERIKKDCIYAVEKNTELNHEMNIIRKRIDDFIVLIRKFKKINKKPSLIILCNSSQKNINLFREPWFDPNNNIYSLMDSHNEYTPKYLSVWLQHTLLIHLKEIFE